MQRTWPIRDRAGRGLLIGAAVWIVTALATGCAGTAGRLAGTGAAGGESALAGFPSPSAVPHAAAYYDTDRTVLGSNYTPVSGGFDAHVVVNGTNLEYHPAWDASGSPTILDAARVAYWLWVEDYQGAPQIQLSWVTPPADPTDLWVGLANWDTGVWDWRQPTGDLVDMGSLAPYFKPGQGVLVAVILLGTTQAELGWIRLGPEMWRIEVVDPATGTGAPSSLALDSLNLPHISYYDETLGHLKYAHYDGSAWQIEVVDETNDVGEFNSLCVGGSGQPQIAYFDSDFRKLKYAFKDGGGWHTSVADSGSDVGEYCSMALDSAGLPHIACQDWDTSGVKYFSYNGSTWSGVPVAAAEYDHITLTLDGADHPRIGYRSTAGTQIRYAILEGGIWTDELVAEVPGGGSIEGPRTIVMSHGGVPYIGYYNYGTTTAFVANREGGIWTASEIPFGPNLGSNLSLALDSTDQAHCTCYCSGLEYVYEDGLGWHHITVDPGWTGQRTSIALDVTDLVHVSYYDVTNDVLMYAVEIP